MIIDVLIVLVLMAINGFFSMSEMAVISSRESRLKELAKETGSLGTGARLALQLKQDPGRFLSTVQIGITLIGIFAGAFSGTRFSAPVAEFLVRIPPIAAFAEEAAIVFVVLSITFITLLVGELVPKNLALTAPERIAAGVARTMHGLSKFMTVPVWILDKTSAILLGLFGQNSSSSASVTEEEIKHFVTEGAQVGAIDDLERDMIYRIFRTGDKDADDLMTPRLKMIALDRHGTLENNLSRIRSTPAATRFPVFEGDITNITGVVRIKDMVDAFPQSADDLFRHMRAPVFVADTTPAYQLLSVLQTTELHMAIVVDEYGSVLGLVTLSDVMTAILGDIKGEMANQAGEIIRRADGSFLVDGLRPADDLKDVLGLARLPREEGDYSTVAGMIIANLRSLPREGDSFIYENWCFEVIDLDRQRIDKVLISPQPPDEFGASGI